MYKKNMYKKVNKKKLISEGKKRDSEIGKKGSGNKGGGEI